MSVDEEGCVPVEELKQEFPRSESDAESYHDCPEFFRNKKAADEHLEKLQEELKELQVAKEFLGRKCFKATADWLIENYKQKIKCHQVLHSEDARHDVEEFTDTKTVVKTGFDAFSGWHQENNHVVVFFTVPKLRKSQTNKIKKDIQGRSLRLDVSNVNGVNYTFILDDLYEEIVSEESYFNPKRNEVKARLKKKRPAIKWDSIIRMQTKDERRKEHLLHKNELENLFRKYKMSESSKMIFRECLTTAAGHIMVHNASLARDAAKVLDSNGVVKSLVITVLPQVGARRKAEVEDAYRQLLQKAASVACTVTLQCEDTISDTNTNTYDDQRLQLLCNNNCTVVEFKGRLSEKFCQDFPLELSYLTLAIKTPQDAAMLSNLDLTNKVKRLGIVMPVKFSPKDLHTLPNCHSPEVHIVIRGVGDSHVRHVMECIGKLSGKSGESMYPRLHWLVLPQSTLTFTGLMALSSMVLPPVNPIFMHPSASSHPFSPLLQPIAPLFFNNNNNLLTSALRSHAMLGLAVSGATVDEPTKNVIQEHFQMLGCSLQFHTDL